MNNGETIGVPAARDDAAAVDYFARERDFINRTAGQPWTRAIWPSTW